MQAVADELGCDRSSVRAALDRWHIPKRARPPLLNDRDALAALYQRQSATAIAASLNVEPNVVIAALDRLGIPRRTHRQAQQARWRRARADAWLASWRAELRRRHDEHRQPALASIDHAQAAAAENARIRAALAARALVLDGLISAITRRLEREQLQDDDEQPFDRRYDAVRAERRARNAAIQAGEVRPSVRGPTA